MEFGSKHGFVWVFRSTSNITTTTGLIPVANVTVAEYQDTLTQFGTYYYAIEAANVNGTSVVSNCESVVYSGTTTTTTSSTSSSGSTNSKATNVNPFTVPSYPSWAILIFTTGGLIVVIRKRKIGVKFL